jgi:hypothetical protein
LALALGDAALLDAASLGAGSSVDAALPVVRLAASTAALAADFTVPHGAAFTVAAVGPTVAVVGPTVAADTGNRGSIRDSVIR